MDERTDRRDETVTFLNFANAPKIECLLSIIETYKAENRYILKHISG